MAFTFPENSQILCLVETEKYIISESVTYLKLFLGRPLGEQSPAVVL
jgi:hypothetical protein